MKKNNNEYEYKNEAIMKKVDGDNNTNLKCEHEVDNKIVYKKYGMNNNEHVAREYNKDD